MVVRGICQLCGCEKDLIKAHVFPRQFNRDLKGQNTKGSRVYKDNAPSKHTQNGIYDDKILCADCDGMKLIGKWDKYGQNFLQITIPDFLKNPRDNIKYHRSLNNSIYLLEIPLEEFDCHKLKLFFLSIMFRSHITRKDFCSKVNLGKKHFNRLKEMIINEDSGGINDFSVFFKKYSDLESTFIAPPCRQRDRDTGINGYWVHLPGYGFGVKVDSRSYPSSVSKSFLSPNQSLLLVIDELKSSTEFSRILGFVHKSKKYESKQSK